MTKAVASIKTDMDKMGNATVWNSTTWNSTPCQRCGGNARLPERMDEPREVTHRGIIKRFSFDIEPQLSKTTKKGQDVGDVHRPE